MSKQRTEKRRRSRGHADTEEKKIEKKPYLWEKKTKRRNFAIDRKTGEKLSREERQERRRRQVWIQRIVVALILITILIGAGIILKILITPKTVNRGFSDTDYQGAVPMPDIDVQLLTVNEYSRPGIATEPIRGVVIHYTANPGSTAQQNRDYFENLKDTHTTKASSNFIVGLDGEIIQCVPTSEMAYASNSRNSDTVSIECCHPDETGKFTDATYNSVVQLTAFLCSKFGLTEEDVIRHYDVTGKDCPRYFVANEDAWETFRSDVGDVLRNAILAAE